MESLKNWVIGVLIKKGGPSAIRGAILALVGWILAHQGMLETFGIIYDKTANVISVHLDKLNGALVLLLPTAIAGGIKILNYHAAEALPQNDAPKP